MFKWLVHNSTNPNDILFVINIFLHVFANSTLSIPSFSHKPLSLCLHSSHWSYEYPFLQCSHDNEHIGIHDTINDVFALNKKLAFMWLRSICMLFPLSCFKHLNVMLTMSFLKMGSCRNLSFGLATKVRGLQGCGPRGRPRSHFTCSRECKECEGMNPHTPKGTPMLVVGVPKGFPNS
jgi:hypothetical protein